MEKPINEDLYLISNSLIKEDKIYQSHSAYINKYLNNLYHQAIFGHEELTISPEMIHSPINRAFYMRYAKILDMVQNANGKNEELTNARTRLLLVLGNNSDKLMSFFPFEEAFKEALGIRLSNKELQPFYCLAKLFLLDILKGYTNEFLLRKLIFITIYHDISKDYRIDNIVNRYKNTPIGKKVKRCIDFHEYGLFMPPQDNLKLTKKKPNN